MSDSLWLHGLQHARLPYPSSTLRACSNSLSRWSHPTFLSSVVPFSSCLQFFAKRPIKVFSNKSVCIRWPKYWSFSFSISPSNEYSGLISFAIDLFDLLEVQVTLKSLLQHHSSKALIFQCSAFPGGSDGRASAYNAGYLGSIPGLGRSPGEGNGNPL